MTRLALDTPTLLVAVACIYLGVTVAMIMAWRLTPTMPGLGYYALAHGLAVAGAPLVALRGMAPDLLTLVLGQALFVLSGAMLFEGDRVFFGLPARLPFTVSVAAAAIAALGYYVYAEPSSRARTLAFSAALGTLFGWGAWIAARRGRRLGDGPPALLRALSLAAVSAVFALRFTMAAAGRPLGGDWSASALILVVGLAGIGGVVAVLMIVGRRLLAAADRARRALATSEERYRTLFEQSLGLICTHSLDGRLLTVNDAAAAALGRSPDQMVGHHLEEFLAPRVRGKFAEYLAVIAAEGEMSGTMILLDDGGGERVWQYRNLVVREPGEAPCVVGHALDVTDRTELERVLREQALTDPLTGLANRALFEDRLQRALNRATREAGPHGEMPPLALAYLDLDGFKEINDRFGHAAGDALLREIGSRLRQGVRTLDTVARLGGDEFALILPEIGSAADARRLIERLLESLRRPFSHDGAALAVSVSLGVSMLPRDGHAAETLTALADEAMYAAKAAGRNTYRFFGDAGNAGKRGPGEGRAGSGEPK